jgi:AAA domain-containing protein
MAGSHRTGHALLALSVHGARRWGCGFRASSRQADPIGVVRTVSKQPSAELIPDAMAADPYALSLKDFVAQRTETRPPLLGTADETLLPAGGLLILFGKATAGKTTFTVDGCFHLASGMDWLGMAVPRPLRILIIENEGPREEFRRKLERKQATWKRPLAGAIFVRTLNWGTFTLGSEEERERLRSFIEDEEIDLVVGDPLSTLGMKGVGSPEDTRAFVELLTDVRTSHPVAWWLLHHRIKIRDVKRRVLDELDEASGDWGGKPDTMLQLAALPDSRARLSFPKVRWRTGPPRRPAILEFTYADQSFAFVGDERDDDPVLRDLVAEVTTLLSAGDPRTLREICAPKKPEQGKPGIGAAESKVKGLLLRNPDVFVSVAGSNVGRHPKAKCWVLRQRSDVVNVETTPASQDSESYVATSAYKGGRSEDVDPHPTSVNVAGLRVTRTDPHTDKVASTLRAAMPTVRAGKLFPDAEGSEAPGMPGR